MRKEILEWCGAHGAAAADGKKKRDEEEKKEGNKEEKRKRKEKKEKREEKKTKTSLHFHPPRQDSRERDGAGKGIEKKDIGFKR